MVVLGGGGVSYARGTPAGFHGYGFVTLTPDNVWCLVLRVKGLQRSTHWSKSRSRPSSTCNRAGLTVSTPNPEPHTLTANRDLEHDEQIAVSITLRCQAGKEQLTGFKDLRRKIGSSQGQNLALTGVCDFEDGELAGPNP